MAAQRLCTILAVFIALAFCLPGVKAQKSSKPLAKQDVLELLTGDVPPERVAAIIREQGVSFKLDRAAEDQIRQAGGNDELLKIIRELAPKAPASPAGKAKPPAPERPAGPPVLMIEGNPGDAHVYIDDEPVGTTSPEGRLKISTLSPGAHRVRLAHRGFQDHEETVQLISGETILVATNLQATATTPVQAPAGPAATVKNPMATVSDAPGYLGIRAAEQQSAGSRRVVILHVAPGEPAARSGMKANDIILSIGDRGIRTPQDLHAAMASHKAGETVEVTWSSGSSMVTKSIQLSARPANPRGQESATRQPLRPAATSGQPGIVNLPVMHDHGSDGKDYCVGVMAIGNGKIQYRSNNGIHNIIIPLSDVEEATKNAAYLAKLGAFHIRLLDGTLYNFVVLDSNGQFEPPDAVLAAIARAMGKR